MNLPRFLLMLVVFLSGVFLTKYYYSPKTSPQEEATVLLERIRTVSKLVTVEGQFSEIYNYSEYQGYFSVFWDKKALVRVRATVSAGYDLEGFSIQALPETRTIRVGKLPEPKILSMDHTLDYYDITSGIFTSFSPDDYNKINHRAKQLIQEKAEKSSLLPAARKQGEEMLSTIKFLVESAGWKLEIEGAGPLSN